jgi:anti-sigma B factor antagonist
MRAQNAVNLNALALNCIDWDIGEVTVLNLAGRITLGEGTLRLRETIDEILARGRNKILLNFSEVFYVDSAGLGTLVQVNSLVRNAGGKLKLMKLKEITRDLIQITRLYSVFEIFPDEASALDSFKSEPAAST